MWDIVVACLTICFVIYLWATWNYNYWKKFDIPYVKPIPFFGNIKDLFLMKKNSGEVYSEFYWKYPDEPAVGIYTMRQPQLVIRDVDLIKTVLVKEFNSFHDNIYSTGLKKDLVASASVFTAKGDKWKTLRSLHTHSLTSNKIKGMFPLMEDVCKEMKEYIKQNLDTPIDTKYFSGQYTTDFVASCVYGLKTNSFIDPDAEFRKMSAKIFSQDFSSTLTIMIITLIPKLAGFLNISLIPKDVTNFFIKVVKDLYEHRKTNNIIGNDFLQSLLDDFMNQEQPKCTIEEIAAHTLTFFVDGYETTSTVMAFTLYMIALHPDVQERVREEIKEISRVDYETINDLKYLDAVINETLRLYPPGLVLTRECTKDIALKSGDRTYPLVEGMTIAVPLYPLFRDPKHYTQPAEFDPSRFYDTTLPSSFFPFGLGPRACLGSKFALIQIKVALVHLIENYEIIPRDSDAKMPDLNPQNAIVIVPKSGLWVKFKNIKEIVD